MRRFIDVFSPVFGAEEDPASISQQVERLGKQLGLEGRPMDLNRIWPAVRLTGGSAAIPAPRIAEPLDHAARAPSGGVIILPGHDTRLDPETVKALASFLEGGS